MSKADGKCNKCKGKGLVDAPVAHLGIPGLCYRCDGAGTYAAEAAIKERGRKLKAAAQVQADLSAKVWAVKQANPGVARISREERRWAQSAGGFSTQAFADQFGYTKRDAWVKLCVSYPQVLVDVDWDTGELKGWAT